MKTTAGFSIIEIIVACAIFLGTISAFVTASEILREISAHVEDKTHAALFLEEGAEAILLLRDLDWDANLAGLTLESPYSLSWDGDSYVLTEGDVVIGDGYWRRVTFFEVYRDAGGSFAESGTVDPNTLRAEIEILTTADGEVIASATMLVHNAYE